MLFQQISSLLSVADPVLRISNKVKEHFFLPYEASEIDPLYFNCLGFFGHSSQATGDEVKQMTGNLG